MIHPHHDAGPLAPPKLPPTPTPVVDHPPVTPEDPPPPVTDPPSQPDTVPATDPATPPTPMAKQQDDAMARWKAKLSWPFG
jgi:hypothetical protein